MRLRLPRASWVRIAQRGVVLLVLALLWLSLSSVLVQDPDPRQLSRGGGQLLLQRQGQDELVGIDGEDDDNDNDDVRVQPVQADRFARPTRKGVAVLVDEEMTNVDVSAETDKLRKDRFKAVTTSNADNLFGRGHIPVRMAPELVSAVLPSMEAPEMVEELQRFDVRGGDGGDEDDDDEDGNSNKKVVLSPRSVDVVSPDGANRLVAYLAPYGTYNNCLFFTVNRSAVAVLHRSVVMVNFKQYPQSGRALCNLRIVAWSAAKRDTTWKPMYGERSLVRDNGVEKVVYFASTKDVDDDDAADPVVVAKFVMRAYDEGVAWNVKLPDVHVFNPAPGEPYTQIQILSRVVFGGPGRAFVDLGNEFGFETRALDEKGRQWREDVMAVVPLHVQLASSGVHVALSEARNYDFRGMHMHMANQTLAELYLSFTVTSSDVREPLYSPWFVAMLGLGAKELIKHRYLIENLNDPSLIDEDATWVQPGKVYRDVTLSTVGSKQGMSLAHSFDMSYVLLDAGWYGSEYNITSDALHPLELPKKMELNFRKLLQHSAESRVGLFLYINDIALSRQANEAFRLYHIWGIKGVKFGFVNLKASSAKRRILEYVLTCAKYKLLVNIHDNYRPSGISRTLPNLVTQEGIRGDEHQTKADHVLYLPFTRYLIGPADHTYTLEENRLRTMNKSLIMQLAMPIALYSPMQHLFWYLDPWGIQVTNDVNLFFFLMYNPPHLLFRNCGISQTQCSRYGSACRPPMRPLS